MIYILSPLLLFIFLFLVNRRIGGNFRRRRIAEAGGNEGINDEAHGSDESAFQNDGPAAAVNRIYTVDAADDSSDVGDLCFFHRYAFRFLQIRDSTHREEIRDEIDHDREVDQDVELLQESRADGSERHAELDAEEAGDRYIRRTEFVDRGEEAREKADAGGFTSYF